MEINMTKQIKFGVHFRGHWDTYTCNELSHLEECADNIEPQDLQDRYLAFLDKLTSKKIKPSTLVDVDVLETFHDDLDNRVQIDYRENHLDPEFDYELIQGAKYWNTVLGKFTAHLKAEGVL